MILFTGQKVNVYSDDGKPIDCENTHLFLTTTLGHFVCAWKLVARPLVTAPAHDQSGRHSRARDDFSINRRFHVSGKSLFNIPLEHLPGWI